MDDNFRDLYTRYYDKENMKGDLAMKERANKIKNWYEERKDGIKSKVVKTGYCIAGLGVGYFIGKKYEGLIMGIGAQSLYDKGIMKFIDPRTGLDIKLSDVKTVAEALDNK